MSIERADKKASVDKIAASLAKNPLQSEREIARDTWVSKSSVNRLKEEAGQTGAKDLRIQNLLDKDVELMKLIQIEKFRRLNEEKEKVNNSDIDKWEATATKRKAIFGNNDDEKVNDNITIQI